MMRVPLVSGYHTRRYCDGAKSAWKKEAQEPSDPQKNGEEEQAIRGRRATRRKRNMSS